MISFCLVDGVNAKAGDSSPVNQTWSPPPPVSTQNSVIEPSAMPDQSDHYTPQNLTSNMSVSRPLDSYVDYSNYHPQYTHSYSYDPSYLTATHQHHNMSTAGAYMGLHHPTALTQQMSTGAQQPQHMVDALNGGYYAPLDQYSRVQSVGDIKMATQQFETTRHGVSMSQPDLSSATWPAQNEDTKYQVL